MYGIKCRCRYNIMYSNNGSTFYQYNAKHCPCVELYLPLIQSQRFKMQQNPFQLRFLCVTGVIYSNRFSYCKNPCSQIMFDIKKSTIHFLPSHTRHLPSFVLNGYAYDGPCSSPYIALSFCLI